MSCHGSPCPACFQASRWKGCGEGGRHDDGRNGLLLGLWPLMVLARAALQWQSRELPSEVNFRLREVRTKGELVTR